MNTDDFRARLAQGPLVELICQVQVIVNYLDSVGRYDNVQMVAMAEECLRRIAAYTAQPYDPKPAHYYTPEPPRPPAPAPTSNLLTPEVIERMAQAGKALEKAAKTMKEGIRRAFDNASAATSGPLTPEQRDRVSKARYDRAVARERHTGVAYVKNYAAHTRREMGL